MPLNRRLLLDGFALFSPFPQPFSEESKEEIMPHLSLRLSVPVVRRRRCSSGNGHRCMADSEVETGITSLQAAPHLIRAYNRVYRSE